MLTPVKVIKGEDIIITQRENAGRNLFSKTVKDQATYKIFFQLVE